MTMNKKSQEKEEINNKILDTAMQIAVTRGLEAITIEEVARCSGVAKTTIYRRYKNKDDLLSHMELSHTQLNHEHLSVEPTHKNLRDVIAYIMNELMQSINMQLVAMAIASHDDRLIQIVRKYAYNSLQYFDEYIANGIKENIFKPNTDPSFLYCTIIGIIAMYQLFPIKSQNKRNKNAYITDEITELIWNRITITSQ
ncbi:MAG: TetR/AcrR family transcriptional regulator [Bifidobacteriaceae bacterium]|nr:TetR/AcrR family transcriptional regulator [Bifidobacteriaceae bacterium]